jgi:anti-sigma-K factor RskA
MFTGILWWGNTIMNDQLNSKEIELLLPFYVNGTLDDDERRQVEKALSEQASLRDEVTLLRQIQSQLRSKPETLNSPGEFGLKRLQQQLKSHRQARRVSPRWRLAAIAASFLLVVQTSMVMLSPGDGAYQQAGEASSSPLLLIAFSPQATEAEIRQLLLENQLTIVEGPSALGIYKLSAASEPEKLLGRLQQNQIIESAQLTP